MPSSEPAPEVRHHHPPQFAATPWTVDGMVVRDRYGRQIGGADPIAPPAQSIDTAPASSDEMDAQGRIHALAMGASPELLGAILKHRHLWERIPTGDEVRAARADFEAAIRKATVGA